MKLYSVTYMYVYPLHTTTKKKNTSTLLYADHLLP